jgi:hypothetical protein
MDPSKTGLRNTLVHYVPPKRVRAQLSLDRPLCGLVDVNYPDYGYDRLSTAVDDHVQFVAQLLDDWSGQGR